MNLYRPPEHLSWLCFFPDYDQQLSSHLPSLPSDCLQLSSNHLDLAEPDVNNSNSMDYNTQHHQIDPSDLPPIIPMEDGPPKYDPDPSLSEIVAERGFKSDSEMIQRHQEQNRPFRSVSPMDFTSNPLGNNQEFARSGQIEPGDTYNEKCHRVQFSSDPTYDNSVRKGSSPRSVKDPDDYVLMNQDSGDSRRNSCISSGALIELGAIEPDHQALQPLHQPQGQAGNAHRLADSSGILSQAAQKYDPGAHRLAEGHHVEGYDPPTHHQAKPYTNQNHYVNSDHSYARHSTPGLTIDASKLNRFDNAGAMHYNGNKNDPDMSSGPYFGQTPLQDQLDPQFGQCSEHDAHGATHVREAGLNPVGQDQWGQPFESGQTAGSRRHLAILDGRNLLEQPTGPDIGSGRTTGPARKLSTQDGQNRLGHPTGQDFVSAGNRARPYKKGSRSKRPKLEVHDLSEMPVKQYLKLKNAHTHHLPAQQAHRPQDQFQYSPESELWSQPPLQQGAEQHAPHWDQVPYEKEPWDPQFAGQQELLYQDQLMQLPQGDEQHTPHWDQIPSKEGSWDRQLAEEQALHQFHLQLDHDQEQWNYESQQLAPQQAHQPTPHQDQLWVQPPEQPLSPQSEQQAFCQDQILYEPEQWSPTTPQYIPQHNFPIPQGINYAAAGQTSENYEVPPAHIPITAQPLEEGFADISRNSPDLYDLDDWKRNTPVQCDQFRSPSQKTSISEYTNDITSSSARSSPSFPQRSSLDKMFLQAQEAILSDGLDEVEDLLNDHNHNATIETYADFAKGIDLQLPIDIPFVPAARDSSPASESSFEGHSPPPQSRISLKARRNRENPRLKRTAEQKRDRKREQNRKDSKKSVARKQSRREEAEKQSEYIKNSVKKQKGANLEFERNMEDLLAGHNSYLLHEKQEYIGWKGEVCRILDDQKGKDVKEAFEKKQAAKEKFEKFACEYKSIRDKSRKSTVGSQKCRASQDAQLLESEYQILLYSHDLRREKQLKALAELYFTRIMPYYIQQCQPITDKRLQDFITDNQHLLQN